jgi:hypothetical protein
MPSCIFGVNTGPRSSTAPEGRSLDRGTLTDVALRRSTGRRHRNHLCSLARRITSNLLTRRIQVDQFTRRDPIQHVGRRCRPKSKACTEAFVVSDLDREVGALGGLMQPKCDGMVNADGVAACIACKRDVDSREDSSLSHGLHGTKRPSVGTANGGFDRRQPCSMLTTESVQEFGPPFAWNVDSWHYAPAKWR